MTRASEWVRTALVTVLGSGYAPVASGTWGSLVSALLYVALFALIRLVGGSRTALEVAVAAGIVAAFAIGVSLGRWAVARYGRSDPKPFVLDEFAGQWTSLLLAPFALDAGLTPFAIVVGGQFLLFRIFDVIKPSPAREAESLPHGWGIVSDDVIAGVYANLLGQLIWRWLPTAAWLGVPLGL